MATDVIQSNALNFANTSQAMMMDYANMAASFAFSPVDMYASWDSPGHIWGYTGGQINPPSAVTLPEVTAERPTAPTLGTVHTVTIGNAPTLLAAEPILNMPARPSTGLPSAPGASPTFNMPVIPDAPPYTLPPVPTFEPIAIPPAPALDSVQFSETLPFDDLTAPTDTFSFVEQEYKSALLDALKTKLMQDLTNGGYGIESQDEQGLWERLRERELQNMEEGIREATRVAASRGRMMPPGALNAAIAKAQQEAMAKISSISREIALKRGDLYVENRKFTIQEVRQVEDMLQKMFGFMMERALNAAKALVELGIAAFNAQLAKHNYRLERYKAAASVYEALIRAQLAKVEQYKAMVDGARLSVDTQKLHADVYRIQIEGVNALINIYRTEMEAAKIEADIEQLKLQGFKTTVESYTSQVGAKTAEFGMYEAAIRGETAKIGVYESQVKAFSAQTDAFKTSVEAQDVVVRSQVTANAAKVEMYRADVARYSAELTASQQELAGMIAKHDADVKQYSTTVDAMIRASQQNVEAGKANADVAISHAQVIATSVIHAGQVMAAQAAASGNMLSHLSSGFGAAASGAMSAATGIDATITSN